MCAHVLSGPVSRDHCNEYANVSDSWCGWVCGSVAVACGGVGLPCGFLTTGFTSLALLWHAFDRAHCTVESEASQDVALPGPPWLCFWRVLVSLPRFAFLRPCRAGASGHVGGGGRDQKKKCTTCKKRQKQSLSCGSGVCCSITTGTRFPYYTYLKVPFDEW